MITINIARRRPCESGFSYIMTAVCASVLLGMLGLAMDLGRMYIVRTELQSFTDNAAVAAAYELDQTLGGIERARSVSQSGPGSTPNRVHFNTETIPANRITTAFSTISDGGWQANPASGAGVNFVRVHSYSNVPVYMIRVLQALTGGGMNSEMRVSAISFAGLAQVPASSHTDPFSPDAVDPTGSISNTDYHFGFLRDADVAGPPLLYTLKWVPNGLRCNFYPSGNGSGNGNGNGSGQMCVATSDPAVAQVLGPANGYCSGDYLAGYQPNVNGFAATTSQSDRGYIDVGQGGGTSNLAEAIVNNNYELGDTDLSIGAEIQIEDGNRANPVKAALAARFALDSDQVSSTYAVYKALGNGNGRRLMRVPINDPRTNRIIGYATFFMPPSTCGTANSDPCCAEYVGRSATIGGINPPPGTNAGSFYTVKLFSGGF